jgi:hypothetical protein
MGEGAGHKAGVRHLCGKTIIVWIRLKGGGNGLEEHFTRIGLADGPGKIINEVTGYLIFRCKLARPLSLCYNLPQRVVVEHCGAGYTPNGQLSWHCIAAEEVIDSK